jgi:hypothetical protein
LVSLFVWDIPRKLTAGQMTTSMEQGLIWESHRCSAGQETCWRSVSAALWCHIVQQKLTDGCASVNFFHTIWHYITKESNIHWQCHKNIKSHLLQNQKQCKVHIDLGWMRTVVSNLHILQ